MQGACRGKGNLREPLPRRGNGGTRSENASGLPLVLSQINTVRAGATMWAITAVLVLGLLGRASAQDGAPLVVPDNAARSDERPSAEALPSADETLAAYRVVDGWVRAWTIPVEPQKQDPARTTAACITLRLSGKVIGRATAAASDGTSLWRAARDAWVQADVVLPVDKDALRAENIREITPRITIDVQLAGTMTPILGETFAAAAAPLSPGFDGVAMRTGERWAVVFGGTMLATNLLPEGGLRAASAELGLPPTELAALRQRSGVVAYRFASRHLAQSAAASPPVFLYRGGRVVSMAEIDGPGLRAAAGRIAAHLISHEWPASERFGMTGDYNLLSDSYQPLIAPPIDQAAVAAALWRFARTAAVDRPLSERARRVALKILADLGHVEPDEADPLGDAATCGMLVIAFAEADRAGAVIEGAADLRLRAEARITDLFDKDKGWSADLPEGARALGALALVEISARKGAPEKAIDTARSAVRGLFIDTPPQALVAQMPWLGWAEVRLAGKDAEIPAAVALRDLRALVLTFQLREGDLDSGWLDATGGIVFTRGRTPLPTWQSLRPVAFLATMLGDERLTDAKDLPRALSDLRASLRFAVQLTIDDEDLHLARDPQRARGGVRPSLWEPRAGLQPAAMALWTLCETLDSLERRAGK